MARERLDPTEDAWADLSADHIARYMFASQFIKGKHVLEAGAGNGYGAKILEAHGAGSIIAIDIDKDAITTASNRYKTPKITFQVDDCEALTNSKGPFDIVCNFENIEHLQHPERFVQVSSAQLRPGGLLLCSTPDRRYTPAFIDGRPANEFHCNEWYAHEFLELLRPHFASVTLLSQVESFSLLKRRQFAELLRHRLERETRSLYGRLSNAYYYLKSSFKRGVLGSSAVTYSSLDPHTCSFAAIPSIGDYMFVPFDVAELFGRPFCHVALCNTAV